MILTWRKQWRRPYESNWSVFEKVKQLNNISGNDLLIKFNDKYKKGDRSFRNLHTLKGFNLELIRAANRHLIPLKGNCSNCHKQIYGFQLSNNLPFCCTCSEKIVSSTSTSSWESWEFDPIIKDRDVLSWIETIGEISVTFTIS